MTHGEPRAETRSPLVFEALLEARAEADSAAEAAAIDRILKRRFRAEKAIFIADMAGFTRGIRVHGFTHVLSMIYEIRRLLGEEIVRAGGTVLKFEADNAFAVFDTVEQAFEACQRTFALIDMRNRERDPEDRIEIGIGLGYGSIYLIGDEDFFGVEVNLASKLGEDTSDGFDVLLTESAYQHLDVDARERYPFESAVTTVSQVEIAYQRYNWKTAAGG
jgi:class 3 adenylate cyclase